jgi:hypothetical protein
MGVLGTNTGATRLEIAAPDAQARMIRLQGKPVPRAFSVPKLSNLIMEPVALVTGLGMNPGAPQAE